MTTKMDDVKRFYESYSVERGISLDVYQKMAEIRSEIAKTLATRSDACDSIREQINQLEPDEIMSASPTGEASA